MRIHVACLLLVLSLAGCVLHARPTPSRPNDGRGGIAPKSFDPARACGAWARVARADRFSMSHSSFPETAPALSCFVAVRYASEEPVPDPPPPGCGYRSADHRASLEAEAERYEHVARGEPMGSVPLELSCDLPDGARRAAAETNAATLRALAAETRREPYAYAMIEAFGYGHPAHDDTPVTQWLPGDPCPRDPVDLRLFGVNVLRAGRAALALGAGVAPVIVFSGGAIQSPLVEAFLLDYVATCRMAVPRDRVLLDPCADSTHVNLHNTARLLRVAGGRAAYLVTDPLQAIYFQEWSATHMFFSSIDQRSLREWGYLLGSWRQASVGAVVGFWYTPYRFWADPKYRDFSCVR